MPKKEIIKVDKLKTLVGGTWRMADGEPNLSTATKFGNLVFLAGQTGTHPITGELGVGVREQTQFTLERIKMILESVGTSLDNVLSVTSYLTKREDLAAYNEEYGRYFTKDKPARATVEVMLNRPELLVEIMVTACIPD